jgi:hypothetical protein
VNIKYHEVIASEGEKSKVEFKRSKEFFEKFSTRKL